ncbi:MAG: histidine kinase [Microbacteriaceae bacterium]|nr:histidine kinase [Microbacteriaceae bacterium]MCI1206700.1 histidine kinase [Microbacteriaceae bacterium]
MFVWIDRHRRTLTWACAILLTALALYATESGIHSGVRSVLASVASILLCGVVIGLSRDHPGWALGLAWVASLAQMAAGGPAPFFWPTAVAIASVYWAARWGGKQVRRLALISVGAGALVGSLFLVFCSNWESRTSTPRTGRELWGEWTGSFLGVLLCLGLAWTIGTLLYTAARYRRSRDEALVSQRLAAGARERTELARDMHDVLAHSLSVMVSLSDGARLAHPGLPDSVRTPLSQISTVGRSALTDVRSLLARLRSEDASELSLTTLETLLSQLTSAGLTVRYLTTGQEPPVTTTQYRTVAHLLQEGLTNALRHGGTTRSATASVDWGNPIRVRIENPLPEGAPGRHSLPDGVQHWGLLGLRERVALVGGTLQVGPQGATWVLEATLPGAVAATDPAESPLERDRAEGRT